MLHIARSNPRTHTPVLICYSDADACWSPHSTIGGHRTHRVRRQTSVLFFGPWRQRRATRKSVLRLITSRCEGSPSPIPSFRQVCICPCMQICHGRVHWWHNSLSACMHADSHTCYQPTYTCLVLLAPSPIHRFMCMHILSPACRCRHTCVHTLVYVKVEACSFTRVHTYIHTYMHTHVFVHTHVVIDRCRVWE